MNFTIEQRPGMTEVESKTAEMLVKYTSGGPSAFADLAMWLLDQSGMDVASQEVVRELIDLYI